MPIHAKDRRPLLLIAMLVDTVGGGLLLPFELVYALKVPQLSLSAAGAILSLAAAAGIAIGPIAGTTVDRIGPARVVAIGNGFGAVGCVMLLWPNAIGFAVGSFLLGASQRAFYGAFTPLVAGVAASDELEAWFGRLRAARYIGLTVGQALSGLMLAAGTGRGLRLIVVANGASFVAAGLLILAARTARFVARSAAETSAPGYRAALADRVNVALAGLNIAATILLIAPVLALPVVVLERLHLGTWVPGVVTGLLTATTAAVSVFSARFVRGRRRLRNLEIAASLWALGLSSFLLAPLAVFAAFAAIFGGVVLFAVGEALYAPTADALPAALAPPGLQGRYAALHQMAWGISETIAPTLVAGLLAVGTTVLWASLAALAAATVGGYRALESRSCGRDGIAGANLELHVAARS